MESRYISSVEVAKMLRKKLKESFPKTKFSVTTEKYAGGSTVRVKWTDGPTKAQVLEFTTDYEGSGFDGMIDLKFYYWHYLLPDGYTLVVGGTQGSGCTYAAFENPIPLGSERVSISCDSVDLYRRNSADA